MQYDGKDASKTRTKSKKWSLCGVALIKKLKEKQIAAYICYVPLHSAPMGQKLGWQPEQCPVTEDYGNRVLRLPLYADMTQDEAQFVAESVIDALK